MPYQPQLDQSDAISAIPSVSIQAAIVGSTITTIYLAVLAGFEFKAMAFIFSIAFVIGAIGTGVCLTIFGPGLRLMVGRNLLDGRGGIAIALVSTLLPLSIISILIGSPWLAIVAIPYAVPAAMLYRKELRTYSG